MKLPLQVFMSTPLVVPYYFQKERNGGLLACTINTYHSIHLFLVLNLIYLVNSFKLKVDEN